MHVDERIGEVFVETQSLARHRSPRLCRCVNTLHACMHSCTLRRIFSDTQALSLKRKLCHRDLDDRIHMHFHDSPKDTQHHSAHTYGVSLGSTTPLRTPSDTARSTLGYKADLLPSPLLTRRRCTLMWRVQAHRQRGAWQGRARRTKHHCPL